MEPTAALDGAGVRTPEDSVIESLVEAVEGAGVPKEVMVANRSGVRRGDSGPQFSGHTMEAAIYGTGWDGSIVIEANSDGEFEVFTEEWGGAG